MTLYLVRRAAPLLLLCVLFLAPARADEGLWTFDNFPSAKVEATYAFTPTPDWLERVSLASARIAGLCSASFVSPEGLILTNHHCVQQCLSDLSTDQKDYLGTGFVTERREEEPRCPGYEINQLLEIRDVTDRMTAALAGKTGRQFVAARDATQARLEQECQESEAFRCDLVTLYGGGRYQIYRYRRWQDVRLVFAPETSAAFFGGDPENFNFPRHDLDAAFIRVYEAGKPAVTKHYFPFSPEPPLDAQLVFVSGNPGATKRLFTPAQVQLEREVILPFRIAYEAELRGLLVQFRLRGAAQSQMGLDPLLDVENSLKAHRGALAALTDKNLADNANRQETLRSMVEATDNLRRYAIAWPAIDKAMAAARDLAIPHRMLELGSAFRSNLFDFARTLVRAAAELPKPSESRLPEFNEAQLPEQLNGLLAPAPVHPELEIETLAWSLGKLREELGAEDPFVRSFLGPRSPREIAEEAVRGSRLGEVEIRRALWEGGDKAIQASTDPMIRLALKADAATRAARTRWEDEVESIVEAAQEKIQLARFALLKNTVYPDGTLNARLSYGTVRGWIEHGRAVEPFTTYKQLFERATGREPFALPKRWLDAKDRINLATPFNFVTDNDIIGGNSGSPVLDRQGRLVGLVFDGNLPSLAGDYWFDASNNRTVAVTAAAILEALDKVFGRVALVAEIRAAAVAAEAATTATTATTVSPQPAGSQVEVKGVAPEKRSGKPSP